MPTFALAISLCGFRIYSCYAILHRKVFSLGPTQYLYEIDIFIYYLDMTNTILEYVLDTSLQVASPLALIENNIMSNFINIFKMLDGQEMGFEPATWCLLGGCYTNWSTEDSVQSTQPGLEYTSMDDL